MAIATRELGQLRRTVARNKVDEFLPHRQPWLPCIANYYCTDTKSQKIRTSVRHELFL